LECPNNASTLKNKHDEFGADSNDYKNIPLNVARFAQANDLHKMTAKLKPMNFDYELFFQAQQDFEKN